MISNAIVKVGERVFTSRVAIPHPAMNAAEFNARYPVGAEYRVEVTEPHRAWSLRFVADGDTLRAEHEENKELRTTLLSLGAWHEVEMAVTL